MQCWVCGAAADGICRFCGRGICKLHAHTRPFLFEAWEQGGTLLGLAVEDALHCGVCRVQERPINVNFLRQGKES